MTDEIKVGRLRRDLFGTTPVEVTRGKDGEPTRMSFPVSSETPISRWFGEEVLRHDDKSVRMDRLNDGVAPLLFNHNWDDPVGMIDSARIKDSRLWVDAHFFSTDRAQEVLTMVEGGMRNVSIGYELLEVVEDTKAQRYTATDWRVLEVSWATVPADPGVGLGRTADDDAKPVRVTREQPAAAAVPITTATVEPITTETPAAAAATTRSATMAEATTTAATTAAPATQVPADPMAGMNALEYEKARRTAIGNLCKANRIDSRIENRWVSEGTRLEEIANKILEVVEERAKATPASAADLGFSAADTQRYSLFRAMRTLAGGTGEQAARFRQEAAFEIECSRAVAKQLGREPDGIFIPGDVLRRPMKATETRVMQAQPGAQGGYLVDTENMGFIDILRNRSVTSRMGARNLTGLVGNITIPRQTAAGTLVWQAGETTTATPADQTLGQLSMTPKTAIAVTEVGRQLMLQSSPSAESMVMADLAQVVALGVDLAAIAGTGGAQPIGIINTTGITTGQDAATATYAKMLGFQSAAAAVNAILGNPGYVTTPTVAALLMSRSRFTNTDTPLWDGNILDGTMAGFKAMSSVQIPSGDCLFGSWEQVVIGEWGVLELTVNPYQSFNAGVIGIRAMYSVDVLLRYPQAFVLSTNIS